VVLVLIAAYAYYFFGNLPQAQSLDPSAVWPATTPSPQSRFVLRGPAPGRLLSIDVRCPGVATLAITPAVDFAGPDGPLKGVRKLRMANGKDQALSLEIATAGAAGSGRMPDIVLERPVGDAAAPVLRLSAHGGPLQVKAAAIPDEHGPGPRIFVVDGSASGPALQTVEMVTAADPVIDITLPCRPSEETSPLVISLGDLPPGAQGVEHPDADPALALKSIAIISGRDRLDANAHWLACGAPEGHLNWRRPTPGIGVGDCAAGWLSASNLQLAGRGLSLSLQGSAYMRENKVTYAWPLMHELYENEILKLVLSGAALALVGWAGLRGGKD
jgi:hypothetical protein